MNIWVALAVATAISLGPVRPILTTSTATSEARVRETIDLLGAYSNKALRVGLRRKNGALSATLRRSEAATIVERVCRWIPRSESTCQLLTFVGFVSN